MIVSCQKDVGDYRVRKLFDSQDFVSVTNEIGRCQG